MSKITEDQRDPHFTFQKGIPLNKQHNMAVVIGRFQPFHNQHVELINTAAKLAEKVIILVGGVDSPRTPKDPFTFLEREQIIKQWIFNETDIVDETIIIIQSIKDYLYSDSTWAEHVQLIVNAANNTYKSHEEYAEPIILVGCEKDESSFYLKMFPQWKFHSVDYSNKVDATEIRNIFFSEKSLDYVKGTVPEATFNFLKAFRNFGTYAELKHEKDIVENYKKSWAVAPYAPTFVTVDAVVIQSGHVLIVKRGAHPGKGLYALPGGFLDQNESIVNGIIRELREETKLKVPAPVLKGSIVEEKYFDHPKRSSRGRTITHTALIVLPNGPLPKVKGSDDASWAGWVPLGEIRGEDMFEDHKHIIDYFKSRI